MQIENAASTRELRYGLTAQEVIEFIETLEIEKTQNLEQERFYAVNLSVAQVKMREYLSLEDYVREMNMLVEKAASSKAHILCLPEYAGVLPASLFLQYERVMDEYRTNSVTGLPDDMWIYQAAIGFLPECFEVFFATMSALAAAYGIYIAAGSTIYQQYGNFVNRALLFSPEGKLVGYQNKLSSNFIDKSLQIEPGEKLEIFKTEFGKIAMIIGEDIDYFETVKVAHELGAKIIINPRVFTSPYTGTIAAKGINLRVQEFPVYGVQPTMIGKTKTGHEFDGSSGIFVSDRIIQSSSKNCKVYSTLADDRTQVMTYSLFLNRLKEFAPTQNAAFVKGNIEYLY